MSNEPFDQVKRLVEAAIQKSGSERAAFLEALHAVDPELRKEVESKLDSDQGTVSVDSIAAIRQFVEEARKADRIGPYRILRQIGEGGMGLVYEAEQEKPVRRKVALKLIKWGMDSKAVIARFEAERQALALMNHSSIASVYDAGATREGRPYFAMECIHGIPITEYCDKHRLTIKERLKLFIQVCDGVQHAHQKGIIHRDIKPSNVLVVVQDDKPVPKIIDFGVAKATAQRLTEHTVATELGQLIGTPEYMSPEQAEMTNLDIDTRTDLYSLGVLLYELLVGAQPFDSIELRAAGLAEIQRRLREDEPPRPSTRVGSLGEASAISASNRQVDVKALQRQLRGDLDWITMKALEKDRTRRYETANALALDVERYLNLQPVRARPPSTAYQLRKLVSRHKAGFAFGALLLVLLAGSAITMAVQSARIARERDAAEQVSQFLVDLFKVSDPGEARGRTVTAREILDQGAEKLQHALQDQPLTRARLLDVVGTVYRELGLYEPASDLLQQALGLREGHLGRHVDVAESLGNLADVYRLIGDYDRAEKLFQRAIQTYEESLGPRHPDLMFVLNGLGDLYRQRGEFDLAEPLLQRAVEIAETSLGPHDPDLAASLDNLAFLYRAKADYEEAELLFRRVLEMRESYDPDNPDLAMTLDNLAGVYYFQRDYDRALPLFLRALEFKQTTLGPDHVEVAISLHNVGSVYLDVGENELAATFLQRALSTYEKAVGQEHPYVGTTLNGLALLYWDMGEYGQVEPLFRRALDIAEKTLEPNHFSVGLYSANLGRFYYDRRDFGNAEPLLDRALGIYEEANPDHPYRAETLNHMANLFLRQGKYDQAEEFYQHSLSISDRILSKNQNLASGRHSRAMSFLGLGNLARARRDVEKAHRYWSRSLAIIEDSSEHLRAARFLRARAMVLLSLGRVAEARPIVEQVAASKSDGDFVELCRDNGLIK